jgi:hypothetical protein
MTAIYIGFAAVIVVIIAVLLIVRWNQNRALQAAYATPSPGASSSAGPSPIPLVDGTAVGKDVIKVGKLGADTKAGGNGQPVDGIECAGMEFATLHVHPHLSIFVKGVQVQVPRLIGAAPKPPQGCLYWIHTHDASGIIHIESPTLAPPGASGFNLGMVFDIWGQPLANNNVAGFQGPVSAYVNGMKYDGDLRQIPLISHQQITLEIGTPVVKPPNYEFPPNE